MHEGQIVASGLAFPEGPVWHEGSVYFTEITGGRISRLSPQGEVEVVASTGGGPNGATLGPDGALWVTQNGGMTREGRATAGIQRVTLEGAVTMFVTEVGGVTLEGPNDLAFGPDGRLYFTDPRGVAHPAANDRPGRLFVVDVGSGEGELIAEVGSVFPNGIAFDSARVADVDRIVHPAGDAARRRRTGARRPAPRPAHARRDVPRRRRPALHRFDVRPLRQRGGPVGR